MTSAMRILLDEHVCDVQADTVADAIAAASALAQERGRLVVEVMVDGRQWTREDFDAMEAGEASPRADEVHLTSAEPRELVIGVFTDARQAIADATALQSEAAEMLQAGELQPGLKTLNEAITIWQSVQQAVADAARMVALDLGANTAQGATASAAFSRLGTLLRTLCDQLETTDVSGLADTLLYDMPEVAEQWRIVLAAMIEEVSANGGRQ
jgi:hypothetical protein